MPKNIAKRKKFLTNITSKLTAKELKRVGALSKDDLSSLITGAYGNAQASDCADCTDCSDCSDCSDCTDSAAIRAIASK